MSISVNALNNMGVTSINDLLHDPNRTKIYAYLKDRCKSREWAPEPILNNPYGSLCKVVDGRGTVSFIGQLMRGGNFDLDFSLADKWMDKYGNGGPYIFVSNHSNTHDFFVVQEFCKKYDILINVLVATDSLDLLSKIIFDLGRAIGIDRQVLESCLAGLFSMANRLENGESVWMFLESTWNLRPDIAMLMIKIGAIILSYITGRKIVPVDLEYVESKKIWLSEKDLYEKVIFNPGEPIAPNVEIGEIQQCQMLYEAMCELRVKLHAEAGIKDLWNCDVFPFEQFKRYLDRVKLSKGMGGFYYDSYGELPNVRGGWPNEYVYDAKRGLAVPGQVLKDLDENGEPQYELFGDDVFKVPVKKYPVEAPPVRTFVYVPDGKIPLK